MSRVLRRHCRPEIVEAILDGRQPAQLQLGDLTARQLPAGSGLAVVEEQQGHFEQWLVRLVPLEVLGGPL